jgi:uncharacterized protein with gpF-like domain
MRRVRLFERQYLREVYNEIRKPMLEAATILQTQGVRAAQEYAEGVIIVDGIGRTIKNIYQRVGIWSGKKTLAEIRRSVREEKAGFGVNEEWIEAILAYFRTTLLSKAVLPISETTRKDIFEILNQGIRDGSSIDDMVFKLQRQDLPLNRARTIVRTEIGKAQFFGTELGRRESGYETVERWIAAGDHRTRHGHRDMNGKAIATGEKFRVPIYRDNVITGYDMMIGPGDPDASAANIINCRCTKSIRAKRGKDGSPIKKPGMNRETSLILTP